MRVSHTHDCIRRPTARATACDAQATPQAAAPLRAALTVCHSCRGPPQQVGGGPATSSPHTPTQPSALPPAAMAAACGTPASTGSTPRCARRPAAACAAPNLLRPATSGRCLASPACLPARQLPLCRFCAVSEALPRRCCAAAVALPPPQFVGAGERTASVQALPCRALLQVGQLPPAQPALAAGQRHAVLLQLLRQPSGGAAVAVPGARQHADGPAGKAGGQAGTGMCACWPASRWGRGGRCSGGPRTEGSVEWAWAWQQAALATATSACPDSRPSTGLLPRTQ